MEIYLDTPLSPEERASDLLSKMSLEEKIGEIVGREESALGVSQVFALVLDISKDSRNGCLNGNMA